MFKIFHNYYSLYINRKDKLYVNLLIILITIGSFFELIGLGLLFILIDHIFLGKLSDNSTIFKFLNLNDFSTIQLTIFIIIIYSIKNLYLCFVEYLRRYFLAISQTKFQSYLVKEISKGSEIIFHKYHLTSVLKNLISESHITFDLFSNSFFELLAELTLIALLILLLSLQFDYKFIFIYFFLFFVLIFFLSYSSKKVLGSLGLQRSKNLNNINDVITRFVYLFNNLKINEKINNYVKNLELIVKKYAFTTSKFLFIRALPKYIIELSFVIILSLVILFNSNSNTNISFIIFTGIIFVRLFPSFIRIKTNFDNLFFSRQAVKNLYEFKKDIEFYEKSKFKIKYTSKFKRKILFQNINFSYGNKIIFKNANLQIQKNKITGIIGKSGSGKSTFLKIISGLENPNDILISYDGIVSTDNLLRPKVDIVFQSLYLPSGSFYKHIRDFNKFNLNDAEKYYRLMGLKDELGSLRNLILTDNAANLSQGQKQRLCILRSILNNPTILILDEPSSNIDYKNVLILKKIINFLSKKITIIIVSHDSLIYDLFDECYKINKNKFIIDK